ncbi:hypothetical protein QEN19_004124 [Hanseniaspora menglaensis]
MKDELNFSSATEKSGSGPNILNINNSDPVSMDLCDNELFIPTNVVEAKTQDAFCPSKIPILDKLQENESKEIIAYNDKTPLLTKTRSIALSGALAGFLSGVLVCPLDVAKTRLQVQTFYYQKTSFDSQGLKYKGIFNTLSKIVHEEGFKGLYNGLVPITLGYFPTWMIYFSVYEYCKKNEHSPYLSIKSEYGTHAASAVTAGLVSSTITNPIWVVKTRLMLQINQVSKVVVQPIDAAPLVPEFTGKQTRYAGTWDCIKSMYRQEGIRSFYSGLTPTLFGLVHVAIHFPLYEYCKNHIFRYDSGNSKNNEIKKREQFSNLFMSSCFSKMIATAITYPHEIIRTNLQIKSKSAKSLSGVIKYIWSGYGHSSLHGIWKFGNFYKGFGANLVRTVPASMITLISFEYFKDYLSEFT